ncbi:redox-regulated ATPase YchF [Candidatus Roizmanbacteria bacterium RIFCSPLOWO2_01_FULL_40_14]|uniref:Ribosome-binding ATPase YchF n=2 Tax=Candidatus Roizmaniibacteriota TaxID=1752723 RepID=A0A0G0T3B3_9BACT|nr:MAG: GTP-binding protein YchF [Candidatus Roizmanbacteria bacterium GW2011_GWB1_40_7]KKR93324.1 MAG: GTP-binding protein YchF [Candidatus Roizmanbacteria bacterium GW2011_GWA1_41_13]OGK50787.1 MAG: redox-regulated ATPase YchF [Candidatus Roizmanbacteria bacterium RIFCSPLOWO2_01_FULL_40_14]
MNLSVGIVGLPNAGKSTLFNALLKKQAALAANYPFATIEPNVGIVPVPDERLEKLADIVEKEEGKYPPLVPATIEFVDIAGLVKGASKGEGLGNQFLSHIREVDVICHVVRYFNDPDVVHIMGDVNPKRDIEIIETELALADLQTLEKQKMPKGGQSKEEIARWNLIEKIKKNLNNNVPARRTIISTEEQGSVRDLQLLTMKPVLYVFNVSEDQLSITTPPSDFSPSMVVAAKTESELAGLSPTEQREYLDSLGIKQSGLDQVISKAYALLGLISFLTMGEKEVRAWTIIRGMLAPQAAGVIHTDFEKLFIKADVISYNDLIEVGLRTKAKETGRLRLEGREYIVKDGDIIEFKIGK